MHQGIKTFRMTKVSFAASPISLKMSRRELGHQLSRQARYTHGTALRTLPAAASRYVQRARGTRARVVLWDSFGLGGKGYAVRVGKITDERVDVWIEQQNRRTDRLLLHN